MTQQPLRGFRDFYPVDQFKINYLYEKIRQTCRLFGYEEFEGPALESFELYQAKSSDEIINEQAFTFEDRGGERIVVRPELTPTLARMVASKQNELVFPLRWWSFGRFWRYERPQKGRGREFYQWNCDLIGENTAEAEVEILEIIIHFLQSLGLTPENIVIELSDRSLVESILHKIGINDEHIKKAFRFLDRSAKLDPQEQIDYARTLGFTPEQMRQIVDKVKQLDLSSLPAESSLMQILKRLKERRLDQWISINLAITRGFNYYTGFVFEVGDRQGKYRSLLGGGRYEHLVTQVGGKPTSAIGFGMGDMVLLEQLEDLALIDSYRHPAKAVFIALDASEFTNNFRQRLRQENVATVHFTNISQGLRFADRNQIPYAIVIGSDETRQSRVTIKSLGESSQFLLPEDDAIQKIK